MTTYTLSLNPATDGTGTHDPSAAIFRNGELIFGAEEERYTRQKHAVNTFPEKAIRACLDYSGIELSDIDEIRVSWKPKNKAKHDFRLAFRNIGPGIHEHVYGGIQSIKTYSVSLNKIKDQLSDIGQPVPPVRTYNHHRCHAVSALYPSGFARSITLTVDGRGESDSTVVWRGDGARLERLKTYKVPNSLGGFYGAITEYLGFRMNNGEGKVMGLAPYGSRNQDIEAALREIIDTGVDYDVTRLVEGGVGSAVSRLEEIFDRPAKKTPRDFSEWEQALAYTAQKLLEEIVVDIVEAYCKEEGIHNIALAGGVALNCKMNKAIMESDEVDSIFIQPISHDAGTVLGAGWIDQPRSKATDMLSVYLGPRFSTDEIQQTLDECKLEYSRPKNLERLVAERIAHGELVGWFQGRLEKGPRALGNRSILADPRTVASRDRVNEYVKHREEWRPFAPSLLEEAADEYLINAEPSPFMIKTFDVVEDKKSEIPAVLHPSDETTRPQTVRPDQNERYHELITQFEEITGVPILLNTSFNDHGEPIVRTPQQAVKDFFGMGLDLLVIEDMMLEKQRIATDEHPSLVEGRHDRTGFPVDTD